jgi:MFS family permease
MGQLDASIVTVALPRIGRDLHASVGAVEWIALSYLLLLISTVAIVGQLADAIGRKLLYTYGFGVFTAGSALCAVAPSLPVLIAARVIQALGAAMLQANSVALITEALPSSLLGRGIGLQGSAQAIGLAVGPALGGLLLAFASWRMIFLINVPAGALGLVLGWVFLPRSRTRRKLRRGLAIRPIVLVPEIWRGLASGLISFLLLFGALFVVPYSLAGSHISAVRAGLELAALPAAIGVAAPIAGKLADRLGGKPLMVGGMMFVAGGMATIAIGDTAASLVAGLALAGIGLGAFTPANNASVMAAAPDGYTGLVGGLLNTARGAGTGLGVVLAGALYTASGLTLTMAVFGAIALAAGALLSASARSPRASCYSSPSQ